MNQNSSSSRDVHEIENKISTDDKNKVEASNMNQSASLKKSNNKGKKPANKSKTGYMGLRKGFLL